MRSLRDGWEMVYKLHFPLGWVRAVCVRDSCQLPLTKLCLPFSPPPLYFVSPPSHPLSLCVCVSLHVSQGLTVNSYSSIWLHYSNSHTNTPLDHQSETTSTEWLCVCVCVLSVYGDGQGDLGLWLVC